VPSGPAPVGCDHVHPQTAVNVRGEGPSLVREVVAAVAVVVAVVATRVEPATGRGSIALVLHNPQRFEVRQGAAVELAYSRSERPNRQNVPTRSEGCVQPILGDDVAVVQDRVGFAAHHHHHHHRLPTRFRPGSWHNYPAVA